MLNFNFSHFFFYSHTQILLSCNGYGQITVPSIHDAFLQHYHPESELSQVLSFYSILKTMVSIISTWLDVFYIMPCGWMERDDIKSHRTMKNCLLPVWHLQDLARLGIRLMEANVTSSSCLRFGQLCSKLALMH